jgi:hypothetical protein
MNTLLASNLQHLTSKASMSFYQKGRRHIPGAATLRNSICMKTASIYRSGHIRSSVSNIHTFNSSPYGTGTGQGTGASPPSPPNHNTLPTLDASPILDPSVYIKKSSKASHTIGGSEAAKRLLKAQHQIRTWIWKTNDEREKCEFGLVGTGVPFQLLQDHVDSAWKLLKYLGTVNDSTFDDSDDIHHGRKHKAEVVECKFSNGKGKLDFDWIKVRTRDNEETGRDISLTSSSLSSLHHSLLMYLTVMNRISTTFGTILTASHSSAYSSFHEHSITSERYWKKDILAPITYWRVTMKRGFVYPPSATVFSTALVEDMGGKGDWTGPPIVELVRGKPLGDSGNVIGPILPSRVKITLQGIPTVFWKENEGKDSCKKDMVPISLCFEACFEQ